jgi:mercuric ion transport protein
MYDTSPRPNRHSNTSNGTGTFLAMFAGLATGFAVASINALPMALNALGVSSSWIGNIGDAAAPYKMLLLSVGAVVVPIGAVMLWFQQQTPYGAYADETAAPPAARVAAFMGLALGAALLLAGYCCG